MIETIENGVQLVVCGFCSIVCFVLAYRLKEKEWDILALFYAAISLGDLYWQLYTIFNSEVPQLSYISEFAYYAAYLFLLLLMRYVVGEKATHYFHPILWLILPFVIGMCIFYMRWGDYLANMITAFLMGMLMWHSLRGLLYFRKVGAEEDEEEGDRHSLQVNTRFCAVVFLLCIIEYTMWTVSCFNSELSITNPYYIFDFMFTLCMAVFLPLFGKAVKA